MSSSALEGIASLLGRKGVGALTVYEPKSDTLPAPLQKSGGWSNIMFGGDSLLPPSPGLGSLATC